MLRKIFGPSETDSMENWWNNVEWIDLAQDRE
jgi:hypothetical protein